MARGRGGKTTGQIGKAYANRTDMQGANVVSAQPVNTTAKLPVMTATNQPYGAATAQANSQSQLAMGGTETPPPSAMDNSAQPQNANPFSGLTALNAPGDRNQSLFHGMDSVAGGGGSEALVPQMNQQLSMTALGLLDSLGDNVSSQVTMIKNYLRAEANNGIMQ